MLANALRAALFVLATLFVAATAAMFVSRGTAKAIEGAIATLAVIVMLAALVPWTIRKVRARAPDAPPGPRYGLIAGMGALAFIIVLVEVVVRAMFIGTLERSSEATMKSDLRNIASAQQRHRDSADVYASSVDALGYRMSNRVRGPEIALTSDGYTAKVGYEGSDVECAIYEGTTALAPALMSGVPRCNVDLEKRRRPLIPAVPLFVLGAIAMFAGWRRAASHAAPAA